MVFDCVQNVIPFTNSKWNLFVVVFMSFFFFLIHNSLTGVCRAIGIMFWDLGKDYVYKHTQINSTVFANKAKSDIQRVHGIDTSINLGEIVRLKKTNIQVYKICSMRMCVRSFIKI